MIVKLDKGTATTEGISNYIFYYYEKGFGFYPNRREILKFMGTKHDKDLRFLDTLALSTQKDWDALEWNKKQ